MLISSALKKKLVISTLQCLKDHIVNNCPYSPLVENHYSYHVIQVKKLTGLMPQLMIYRKTVTARVNTQNIFGNVTLKLLFHIDL